MVAGDGETACDLMTERGRNFFARVSRNIGLTADGDDCVAAVETVAESPESAPDPIAPADVSLGATELPGAGAGNSPESDLPARKRYAEVACRFRGSYGVERIGEDWRVFVPLCFD